ncbi:hypothetical protein VTK73DRAFT_2211 [Phialemonium thermophilum]|uniref:Oleate hydratase n=1 Tax=Phialemonium thermophilum TaxID=223376 RepID=A0ABR3Y2C7_9PEZI
MTAGRLLILIMDYTDRPAPRHPEGINVYLVGGGIASLAAAVHLCHDAQIPARQIHLIEASPVPGGSMGGAGDWKRGYVIRAARKLNFTYHCLYDTLSRVPSLEDPSKTVLDDISATNKNKPGTVEPASARLVDTTPNGPEIVDVHSIGLSKKDRLDLLAMLLDEEENLASDEIQARFQPGFFETIFWDMWSSMYGFQQWHSAAEFRRYLHRFLHEFPHISTLEGIEYTPMNDYQSVILPLEAYLKNLGVDFKYGTKVTSVSFRGGDELSVSALHLVENGHPSTLDIPATDLVFITLGSMTAGTLFGNNERPPPPIPAQDVLLQKLDPIWKFWSDLANPALNAHAEAFGRPEVFCNRISKSSWLSFTTTLVDGDFVHFLRRWSRSQDGSCPLVTFRYCPWMLSITLPRQPYFMNQPDNVYVLWGYGLYPDQEGMFVNKPMMQCSGQEILMELLQHLGFPLHPTLERSTTIPCLMPYIGSPFLSRSKGDRPQVIPSGSQNLALLGQFVEIERDVTFTMEYSVRGAQMAVYGLMGLDRKPPALHRGDKSARVLGEALMAIMS